MVAVVMRRGLVVWIVSMPPQATKDMDISIDASDMLRIVSLLLCCLILFDVLVLCSWHPEKVLLVYFS
jgi:hypothetical protein